MEKKGPSNIGFLSFGVICHFHEYGRCGKPKSVWIISPICKSHFYTHHLTANRFEVVTSVGAESLWHLLAIWKPMWCEATCWGILPDLEILKYLYKFVWFESDFLFRHNWIALFLHVSLTEKMNFLNNHIYTWHLVPIAVFDVLFALDLHKGLSLFLWSSSFIPQNALPVMVGPNASIYSLPCFGWVSPHLHQWKCSSIFCNRKLKWFTTLKPWQFNFLMVPHPLECSSDFLKKKRHKWN